MNVEQNQISVINSTEEEFADIMAKVDAMPEDQAAELLISLINEILGMQKEG